jgi:hypothetical protein
MARLTSQFSNLLDARIGKYFYYHLKTWPKEYPQWCQVMTSDQHDERMAGATELGMPSAINENEAFPEAAFVELPSKTFTHQKYGFRVIASQELIDDERWPVLAKTTAAVSRAMTHRLETQGAYDLVNSFTTATLNSATEYLVQRSHSAIVGSGGAAQHNAPATDVTLGVDSLWAAVTSMTTLDDEAGNPAMIIPDKVVIEANNERTAVEILESEKVAYKATHEVNAIRKKGLTYVIGHYLTSTTAWWLIARQKPIYYFFRWQPRVERDYTVSTQSRAWQISVRVSHGPYDATWRFIYGTDGAA